MFERHPWPPFREFDRCVLIAVKNLHASENRYLVTAVTPARACPGESITITGSGFGATPGTVRFRRRGTPPGSSTISVPAQSWSDTTVVVAVPADAGCGVQLVVPVASWQACGSVVELFKQGEFSADYIGGAPDVLSFSAAGVHSLDEAPQACTIEPSTFTVTWDVRAADHVIVQVTTASGWRGGVDPAPSVGSYSYDASGVTRTTPLTVRLVASGSCDPQPVERLITVTVQRAPDLRVHGMEVTQAIQHYRAAEHLTDPADRGPDNSLRLVAEKTAYVRVYLRSGQDPGFDSGDLVDVSGTLEVRRFTGGTWAHVVTLSPTPGGARVAAHADPLYPWERGTLAASLNFCVPAGVMVGHLRLEAMVTSPFAIVGGGPTYGSVDVDVTLRQTLKVAGILIGYNGPAGRTASPTAPPLVLPAPQPADLPSTASWVMRTYPVSESPVFRVVGTVTLTKHLQDPQLQSSCSANWDDLMSTLRDFADDDGNKPDWLYYGLLPAAIPMGPVIGCGGGAVGTGQNGDGPTMAEELGHALGLTYHTPCGVSGPSVLSSYPAYEPYDANPQSPIGCIGEYGLDTSTGTVHDPTTADFMGYCLTEWISKHTHERLLNVPALSPVTLTAAAAALVRRPDERHQLRPEAVVALTVSLDSTGAVDWVRVRRVMTRPDHRRDEQTEVVAELLGGEGEVLASATMHALRLCGQAPGRGSDAGPYRLLKAYVPDVARGARLRLRHGDRELWSRDAPAESTLVREVVAEVTEERRLNLRWQAAPEARFTAWVRWSENDGETWRPLTVGLTGQHAVLGLDSLPGGELRFQVVVHDGFESIAGTSASVFVPHRGPSAAVLSPSEGEQVQAGAPLRLWGMGVDEYGHSLPSGDCQWVLDDHPLDPGPDLILDPQPIGAHRAQFVVHDQHGRSVAERSFSVIGQASP